LEAGKEGKMTTNTYYVYILSNQNNTVLYVGVTNDLRRRVWEHKNNINHGFTEKYSVHKLVYYETTGEIESAIAREKQIKGGSRDKKIKLIEGINQDWHDLYEELF
jgi:putative endonuclease